MARRASPSFWKRCWQNLIEWNVFENELEEAALDNNLSKESIITAKAQLLRRQRISTRVYIIVLILSLLILITWSLLTYQTKVVTEYNPSLRDYQRLYALHPTTLACPCRTTTMPYKHFIVAKVDIHQICSSDFVQDKWIDAFYFADSSRYGSIDFRTTANSQFKLLQSLCTLTRENINDALSELNNTQLITPNALSEQTVLLRSNTSSNRIRSDLIDHFKNALKLIRLSTCSSHSISALNTNYVLGVFLGWSSNYTTFLSYATYVSNIEWTVNEDNQTIKCYCEQRSCSFPAGFYRFADNGDFYAHTKPDPYKYNITDVVPGFVGSCTPLDAILEANLTCLYNRTCFRKLVRYFPRLNQIVETIHPLNSSISSRYSSKDNVSTLVDEHFIEQWNISINYSEYFHQCSAKICTYTFTKRADFLYIITLLISLCGGLQTILRFCVPILVDHFLKRPSINSENRIQTNRNENNCLRKLKVIRDFVMNVNLFESSKRTSEAIYRQKLSTRIYLCCLIGSLFILLLFTTISQRTTSITYDNPTYDNYTNLFVKYDDRLICPCTENIHVHSLFVNLTPIYHPICSSAFVTDVWFDQLKFANIPLFQIDWRIFSRGYFLFLSALCEFALETIEHGLTNFNQRPIVTTQVISENDLAHQLNDTIEQLIQSMNVEFQRVSRILELLFQVNHYSTDLHFNSYPRIVKDNYAPDLLVDFRFHGPLDYSTYVLGSVETPECVCAFDGDCEQPMFIIHNGSSIPVPGFVIRCSIMNSLLQTTLECLYSNTDCLERLLFHYMAYSQPVIRVEPMNVTKLIRTRSNSTVSTIVDNLFVEQWQQTISHEKYFHQCAPKLCQYTFIQRANYLYIVTVFLAVYGGLIFSLRLLIPIFVKLVLECRQLYRNRNDRLHTICQGLSNEFRLKIIELNLFSKYSYGRLTTKFYICLYVIGLIILATYTSIEQRTLNNKIHYPSLSTAQRLLNEYVGTTECPCTKASIPIGDFVYINPYFHGICRSIFVNSEWQKSLIGDADSLNVYNRSKDYRLYLPVHLQFLDGLCKQSIEHVNDTVRSFVSTLFVTNRLLSQISFDAQISNLFNQMQMNIPTAFNRALHLAQTLNRDNKLLSSYESNYELFVHPDRSKPIISVYAQAMNYEYNSTNCSCGLQANCVANAMLNHTKVKGLFVGCLPSDSFLVSTLECFFDQECIDLLQSGMSADMNRSYAQPLQNSSYRINTTVKELVAKLFVETWSTKISYDRYFIQCAPIVCSYSYIDNANPLYVATTLLGLYGGLSVVLSWWCPQFIQLIRRIYLYFNRNQRIRVVPSIS